MEAGVVGFHGNDHTVLRTLREIVGGDRDRVLFECRHCGANVEGPGDRCPECGGGEIARFVL